MTKKKKTGRPRGSRNKKVEVVDTESTSCPSCGSNKRAAYWGKIKRELSGTAPDGRIFEAITYRRTKCEQCGQHRVDREFSFKSKSRAAPRESTTAANRPEVDPNDDAGNRALAHIIRKSKYGRGFRRRYGAG